jgi:tetratricopeptide (TPR) repeat protein
MKFACSKFPAPLALVVLTAGLLGSGTLRADEYGDVNQLVRTGKPTEALATADQYLAAKPKEAGRTADAVTAFQQLTEDYPELPEPYNNLAVLYAGQGQFDKARAALEMAIRTNPSYSTAHENLGDVYMKLASEAYNKTLQLDPANAGVRPKLALIRELFSGPGARTSAVTPAPPR